MQLFSCPACGARATFGNTVCVCGDRLTFDPAANNFVPQHSSNPCSNRASIHCNWAASDAGLCASCRTTEIVPDQSLVANQLLWERAEAAKRWVLQNLGRWGWLTDSDPGARPRFHLLAEKMRVGRTPVIMGHADGLITINVQEADPAERTQRRENLSERLRTMTAHFRHEIAHFLFERLATEDPDFLTSFRAIFGDERADYQAALDRHYSGQPPADWADRYITRYASSHPHEDWAETAAHILHLTDITDSAVAAGLYIPWLSDPHFDSYAEKDSDRLISAAIEIGLATNHINRSMGLDDLYPFVISPTVRSKIAFAHARLANHIAPVAH